MKKRFLSFIPTVLLTLGFLAGCGSSLTSASSSASSTIAQHTVTFYVDAEVYGTAVTVEDGAKVTRPSVDPTKEDDDEYTYAFDGWYESNAETAWNFDTNTVSHDIDLFANFTGTLRTYDLVVWAWGGDGTTVYISEDEFNNLKTVISAEETYADSDILWKYKTGITNDVFNSTVGGALIKPDVIISGANMTNGDYALSLDIEGPRTKMGLGWFGNTSRYAGILNTVGDHFTLAKGVYDILLDEGPDYFNFPTTITVEIGESKDLLAVLPEGETRTVLFSGNDVPIATYLEGQVTGVAEGVTTIIATLGFYAIECTINVVIPVSYDLIVWVYGINSTATTYISEVESTAMRDAFLAENSLSPDSVNWVFSQGLTNTNFNAAVNGAGNVDVVISGNKIDSDTDIVLLHTEYGKVDVGGGWFANTSRKVGVCASVDTEHLELAVKLYDMVRNPGPAYEVSLNRTTLTLAPTQTEALVATYYGEAVTWESNTPSVATIDETGLVTAVADGSATITVTDAAMHTATCIVTVQTVVEVKDLVVDILIGTSTSLLITEADVALIISTFEAALVENSYTDVNYEIRADFRGAGADFCARMVAAGDVDVAIGASNLTTQTGFPGMYPDSLWTNIKIGITSTSRYVGVISTCSTENLTLAQLFVSCLTVVA